MSIDEQCVTIQRYIRGYIERGKIQETWNEYNTILNDVSKLRILKEIPKSEQVKRKQVLCSKVSDNPYDVVVGNQKPAPKQQPSLDDLINTAKAFRK